jgi:hypothetical protein
MKKQKTREEHRILKIGYYYPDGVEIRINNSGNHLNGKNAEPKNLFSNNQVTFIGIVQQK